MTMNANEQLSAMLDGELPDAEVDLAVRRVARDEAVRATALRYSLIGDALRDELPAGRPADLVERVSAALRGAQTLARRTPAGVGRYTRFGVGFAVAASVAMVALVALPGRQQDATPPVLTSTEVAAPAPEQRMMIQPTYTRAAGGGPDRLTRYYVNHSEYAPAMGGRGALTRIIVIQPEPAPAAVEEERADATPRDAEENGNAQ